MVLKAYKRIIYSFIESRVECNICGWKDHRFASDQWHKYTVCPGCNSQVRQRLFWAIMKNDPDLNAGRVLVGKKIIHIAPDPCLESLLAEKAEKYVRADMLAEGYSYERIDVNLDMSDMHSIGDEEYDCLIAFDVLEHIPDHLKAIRESCRILSPGGYCIFMVPQKDGLDITFEDSTVVDPDMRARFFGQRDHHRIYGNDFSDMMEKAGFVVTIKDEKSLDVEMVKRNVLYPPVLSSHPLATNNRKVYFGQKKY